MKKTILSTLAIAAVMGVQGQGLEDNPTSYENPFACIGKMDYMQRQSEGAVNKWFLSGKEGKGRCFVTESVDLFPGEESNRNVMAAKIVNKEKRENADDLQFCIIYEVTSPYVNTLFELSYYIRCNTETKNKEYRLTIKGIKETKDVVKNHYSNTYWNGRGNPEDDILYDGVRYTNNRFNCNYIDRISSNHTDKIIIKDYQYISVQFDFGKEDGVYWIADVTVKDTWAKNGKTNYFGEQIERISEDGMDDIFLYKETSGSETQILDNTGKKIGAVDMSDGYVEWRKEPVPTKDGCTFVEWVYNGTDFTLTPVWEGGESGQVPTSISDNTASMYYSNGVIYSTEPKDIAIYSASGVVVRRESHTCLVSVEDLKAGVYVVKADDNTIKFVK